MNLILPTRNFQRIYQAILRNFAIIKAKDCCSLPCESRDLQEPANLCKHVPQETAASLKAHLYSHFSDPCEQAHLPGRFKMLFETGYLPALLDRVMACSLAPLADWTINSYLYKRSQISTTAFNPAIEGQFQQLQAGICDI